MHGDTRQTGQQNGADAPRAWWHASVLLPPSSSPQRRTRVRVERMEEPKSLTAMRADVTQHPCPRSTETFRS